MKFKGITSQKPLYTMVKTGVWLLVVGNIITAAAPATIFAQESLPSTSAGQAPDPLHAIPESELEPPPAVPRTDATTATRPARLRSQQGEVLTANSFVRELTHDVEVEIQAGLALIRHRMTFENRGAHPSEVRVRLAAPRDSDLAGLRVCIADHCRDGESAPPEHAERAYTDAALARGGEGHPIAFARRLRDARGQAFIAWATPIPPQGELQLTVEILAAVAAHGNVQRLRLPARGADPRVAETSLRWKNPRPAAAHINGTVASDSPVSISSWQPVEITSPLPRMEGGQAELWQFTSAGAPHVYAHAIAGHRTPPPRHLIVLVDTSPSTLGPTSNRRLHGLTGLLAAAPRGSRVTLIPFATNASSVFDHPRPIEELPLSAIERAFASPHGNRTLLHRTWPLIREAVGHAPEALRPLVVLLGDGAIPRLEETTTFERSVVEVGLEFWTVALGDEPAWSMVDELARHTAAHVLRVGIEAEGALDGLGSSPLIERLRDIYAPRRPRRLELRRGGQRLAAAQLQTGSEWRWIGRTRRGRHYLRGLNQRVTTSRPPAGWTTGLRARARRRAEGGPSAALAALDHRDLEERSEPICTAPRPASRYSGTATDDVRVALAEERRCGQRLGPATPQVREYGLGIPAQTVLSQLRSRVIPPARACLRSDRRGRADHSIRATFHLEMGRRELLRAQVTGEISPTLRACLLETLEGLDIPTFRGWIRVRYPIYTEVAPAPEVERGWDPEP